MCYNEGMRKKKAAKPTKLQKVLHKAVMEQKPDLFYDAAKKKIYGEK